MRYLRIPKGVDSVGLWRVEGTNHFLLLHCQQGREKWYRWCYVNFVCHVCVQRINNNQGVRILHESHICTSSLDQLVEVARKLYNSTLHKYIWYRIVSVNYNKLTNIIATNRPCSVWFFVSTNRPYIHLCSQDASYKRHYLISRFSIYVVLIVSTKYLTSAAALWLSKIYRLSQKPGLYHSHSIQCWHIYI